jgi:hypothetical protein
MFPKAASVGNPLIVLVTSLVMVWPEPLRGGPSNFVRRTLKYWSLARLRARLLSGWSAPNDPAVFVRSSPFVSRRPRARGPSCQQSHANAGQFDLELPYVGPVPAIEEPRLLFVITSPSLVYFLNETDPTGLAEYPQFDATATGDLTLPGTKFRQRQVS